MAMTILIVSMLSLLGTALSVSAAISDKMARDNMRDMTVMWKRY